MSSITRRYALQLALVALAVMGLDQLSKWYLLYAVGMPTREPIVVTGFFRLVMVWNKGVSFGMLRGEAGYTVWFLSAMAVIISLILVRFGLKSALLWERIGYAMVIGGALGNVIDRLRFGAVADFFYFHAGDLGWPAFNVADSAICIGVGILLWMMTFHPSKP